MNAHNSIPDETTPRHRVNAPIDWRDELDDFQTLASAAGTMADEAIDTVQSGIMLSSLIGWNAHENWEALHVARGDLSGVEYWRLPDGSVLELIQDIGLCGALPNEEAI